MDQIEKDTLELVKKHDLISVSKLMIEYYRKCGRHLYLEVENLGYRSVHHFLTYFDELIVEMDHKNTFDIHVRVNHLIKKENCEDSASTSVKNVSLDLCTSRN